VWLLFEVLEVIPRNFAVVDVVMELLFDWWVIVLVGYWW
jgi:hypothetical protein